MTAPTEVKVPDIGDFGDVPVIEVHVAPGDQVNAEDPLVTLESDKATMDVPAPAAGSVAEVLVKVGDEVSEGTTILLLIPGDGAVSSPPSLVEQQEPAPAAAAPPDPGRGTRPAARPPPRRTPRPPPADHPGGLHAGPSVRRTARELGIDLGAGHGDRPEGPDHQGRPAGLPQGPGPARRRGRAGRGGVGHPGDPGAGLLQVRAGRDRGTVADQEGVRAVPAPLLAQRPARHAQRRGRHHRPGPLPQGAGHRGQGRQEPVPGHAAGVPGQGLRGRAEAVPRVQLLAVAGEGRADPQAVLQHRHRRGHPRRAGRPGGQGRRPQGHRRAVAGVHGHLGQGPRRQARARRHAGRHVHHLQPGRHRRHQLHPDRQRPRGRHPRRGPLEDGPGLERHRVHPAQHAAALAVLRPPGRSTARWPPASPDTCATCSKTTAGCCSDRATDRHPQLDKGAAR